MTIVPRHREMLQALWRRERLSRRELHQVTGIRPNTVGSDAAALIRAGLIRECSSAAASRGRPRVPLEIDPTRRHVLGVAIRPGHVEIARLNLLGQIASPPTSLVAENSEAILSATSELLSQQLKKRTLSVGLTTPGFVDPVHHSILFSSATTRGGPISLQRAYDVVGKLPIILENDMHALAARWMLARQESVREDVLLVWFDDNQLGSALLIDGRPNRGCVTGANELGHTRFPVETERCYCGHEGCLERICSTQFLQRQGPGATSLEKAATDYDGTQSGVSKMIDLLANGIANAVNFTRVNRLVLVSNFIRHERFAEALTTGIRGRLLRELSERVRIENWDQPIAHPAETAGWLALANLYIEGWNSTRARGSEAQEPLLEAINDEQFIRAL